MDFKAAQQYWVDRDEKGKRMPEEELRAAILTYIQKHNVMALATGYGDFVRNTPVEYAWYQDAFWFLSEGGQKYLALEKNRNVCIAICDQMRPGCHGLQVEGKLEFIAPDSQAYQDFLAFRKIGPNAFAGMPYPMPMMRVIPVSADYFDSSLGRQGYFMRQHLEY